MDQPNEKICKQYDYKVYDFITGTPTNYRMTKLSPQNASTTVNLPVGSTTPVTFELPTDVMNLSRAYLSYTITPSATGVVGVANIAYKDLMSHIQQIQLVTKNQILIADIQNVPLYTKACWKTELKYEDYRTFEQFANGSGFGAMLTKNNAASKQLVSIAAGAGASQYATDKISTYRVYPCISPNNGGGGNAQVKFTLSSSVQVTATAAAQAAGAYVAPGTMSLQVPSCSVGYDEPQYFEMAAADNASTTPSYNIKFPLRLLLNSIFSYDKDLYWNSEIMYVKIFFSPSTACYFTSSPVNAADIAVPNTTISVANIPVNGHPSSDLIVAAATNQAPQLTIAAATLPATITNLQLWVPINRDPAVRQELINLISEGKMKLTIPFVWTLNQAFPAVASAAGVLPSATSQNVRIKFNSSHGKRLSKLYYTLLNSEGASTGALSNLQYDISNLGYTSAGGQNVGVQPLSSGYKVISFQTLLDSKPLQDFIVNCNTGDHYLYQKEYLKGSVILNSNIYDYNFCWIERFNDLFSPLDKPAYQPADQDNLKEGMDLSVERIYDFLSTCNTYFALTHYCFAVTQRELQIFPEGIMLDQTI